MFWRTFGLLHQLARGGRPQLSLESSMYNPDLAAFLAHSNCLVIEHQPGAIGTSVKGLSAGHG
jgi:hypothetical protein